MRLLVYRDETRYVDVLYKNGSGDVIGGLSNSNAPRNESKKYNSDIVYLGSSDCNTIFYLGSTAVNFMYYSNNVSSIKIESFYMSSSNLETNEYKLSVKNTSCTISLFTLGSIGLKRDNFPMISYQGITYLSYCNIRTKNGLLGVITKWNDKDLRIFGDAACTLKTYSRYVGSCYTSPMLIPETIQAQANGRRQRKYKLAYYNKDCAKDVDPSSKARVLQNGLRERTETTAVLIEVAMTNIEAVSEDVVYFDKTATYNKPFYMDILLDFTQKKVTFMYNDGKEETPNGELAQNTENNTLTFSKGNDVVTLYKKDDQSGYLKYVRYDYEFLPPNVKYTFGKDIADRPSAIEENDLVIQYTVKAVYTIEYPESSITCYTNRCYTEYKDDHLIAIADKMEALFETSNIILFRRYRFDGVFYIDKTIDYKNPLTKDTDTIIVSYTDEEKVLTVMYDLEYRKSKHYVKRLVLLDENLDELESVVMDKNIVYEQDEDYIGTRYFIKIDIDIITLVMNGIVYSINLNLYNYWYGLSKEKYSCLYIGKRKPNTL